MSLRRSVVQGGFYLALRQGLGMAIGVVGVLILTRRIGPANYGIFAASMGVLTFMQSVCGWGLNVFLVRSERGDERAIVDQAFTLLVLLGSIGALLAVALTPAMAHWTHLAEFRAVCFVMFAGLPVTLAGQVPTAQLERRLAYRVVAINELTSQVTYYAVGLPLAFLNYGVWAPVLGWTSQQVVLAALSFRATRYLPRLTWRRADIREMVKYGLGFSSSLWVWQLRALINPLIVGRYAGAEAVGFVALSIRIVEYLTFVKSATWRIAIAALAKIQADASKLREAASEGLRLQVLAIGPIAVVVLWMSPILIPRFFGPKWTPSLEVLPYIALSYLVNSMFNMHSSVLYVLKRNWSVAIFHAVHVLLIAVPALALVPRFGILGYGFAELVGIASYAVVDLQVERAVGRPRYGLAFLWVVGFGASLFVYQLGWWPVLALIAVAALPGTWRQLKQISTLLTGFRRASA